MSVRLRSSLVILLLALILVVALVVGIRSSRLAAQDAREIDGTGLIRARAFQIENLTRQIVAADTSNENTLLAIQAQLDQSVAIGRSLVGLFNASDSVDRDEFEIFVRDLLAERPEALLAVYIPRVTNSDRAAFEEAVASEGFGDFQIVEITPEGAGRASERPEYYPATYLVPFEPYITVFGLDVSTLFDLRAALERARDSGQPVAAAPFNLGTPDNAQFALPVFTPIYRLATLTDSPESRRQNLLGFTAVVVNLQPLIEAVTADLAQRAPVVEIADITNVALGTVPQPFYINPAIDTTTPLNLATATLLVYSRVWSISLQQPLDPVATLRQLRTTTAELDNRVDKLQAGAEELGFYGLDRHANPDIDPAYDAVLQTKNTLVNQINTFIESNPGVERVALLSTIENLTINLSNEVDRLIELLKDESNQRVESTTLNSLLVVLVASLITLFGFVTVFQIATTLARVNRSAQTLATGNLRSRVLVRGRYELAQIGQAINQMAQQLQELFSTLEARVAEKTRDLQTVIDLNRQISTILNVEGLLRAATDLTKDRFGLYHAHIYLLNEQADALVLAAGAGYVGRQMVARQHQIPMQSQRSIVTKAASSQTSVLINNTGDSPDFLPNPLLPETRAELAIPLVSRGQLLGVLDVQSDQIGFFNENLLSIMEVLAAQIATALANTRLYETATQTSRREQALSRITEAIQNANNVDEVLQGAVRELGKALRVPHAAIELHLAGDEHTPPRRPSTRQS